MATRRGREEPRPAQVVVDSPVGPLLLTASHGALTHVRFDGLRQARDDDASVSPADAEVLAAATVQLSEYFERRRRAFDVPLRMDGTAFQRAVWLALASVPWGTTTTYGAVAHSLGLSVGASRAVGAANGANPVPILVPCHRVIGADGLLTGYGGGLARKHTLLRLEGVVTERAQLALFD